MAAVLKQLQEKVASAVLVKLKSGKSHRRGCFILTSGDVVCLSARRGYRKWGNTSVLKTVLLGCPSAIEKYDFCTHL